MDALTQQVVALSNKVDALYEIIRQLTGKLSEHLPDEVSSDCSGSESPREYRLQVSPSKSHGGTSLEHKDVLMDDEYIETSYHSREPTLTADLQIQRLTAQLTAAYNRIAALEEQLLAKRTNF